MHTHTPLMSQWKLQVVGETFEGVLGLHWNVGGVFILLVLHLVSQSFYFLQAIYAKSPSSVWWPQLQIGICKIIYFNGKGTFLHANMLANILIVTMLIGKSVRQQLQSKIV